MRRYTKYLILSGTPFVFIVSCTIFYFNDRNLGLLADSRARGLHNSLVSGIQVKLGNEVPPKGQKSWWGTNHNSRHVNAASAKASPIGWAAADGHRTNGPIILNGKANFDKVGNLRASMEDNLLQRNDKELLHQNRVSPQVHGDGTVNINRSSWMKMVNGGKSHTRRALGNHLHVLLTTKSSSVRGYHTHSQREEPVQGSKVAGEQGSFGNFLLSHPCHNPLCTEFLAERDMLNFTVCKRRAETTYSKMVTRGSPVSLLRSAQLAHRVSNGMLLPSGECRFMNGSRRNPVGLVSFPGSGNTWVRGLLQKATGICTGEWIIWCCV